MSNEPKSPSLDPAVIRKNPNNPRRYFNDERLDLLRTSIQEVGILVPLIVYEDPSQLGSFILLDGERRWSSAIELGLEEVPVNIIEAPSQLDNLLRMFNIHSVRDEWPLISIALSLREVMTISGEDRETRLAEMTGLTRSTVRRAKRLLSLPEAELELIKQEAHWERSEQVHREDMYLEVLAAESVLRGEFPEIAEEYPRDTIIRQFVRKREEGSLRAITDFRDVGKLVDAASHQIVERKTVLNAAKALIQDVNLTPPEVYQRIAAEASEVRDISIRSIGYLSLLSRFPSTTEIPESLRSTLVELRETIDRLLETR